MTSDELRKELRLMESVQNRMRAILNEVACVLKGPQVAGDPHDWSDLAELAQRMATERRHLKAWWAEHMSRTADGYEQVAVDLASVRKEALAAGYRQGVVDTIHRFEGRVRSLPDPDVLDVDPLK